MIKLKEHLEAMSDLQESIRQIRELAESLPDGTDKGYLLARVDIMQQSADDYVENTIGLYEKITDFAMSAAS